ncbi:hypothetical protein [Streptomyces mobaraensis]|uniref:Type II toxin-antitoxin system Phd/YefM family antitoxin n=1 Tax=Streptomyces mobaraensis TaxID=35621 RepID=A0A5N5W415_STRMB|nr:hypothetical protein [Streptomyces mobaraensis]KAB7839514.1 hypothetical protein FRZ00_21500 [Streptomyces mobaraensis]
MTHNSNAHDNGTSDAALPKFSVNVVPTDRLRREELATALNLYRRGQTTPLIFGDDNKPEAAIIPFAAFMRLMKYDHAAHVHAEAAFQAELSRRVQESDAYEAGMTVEELAESLGPLGRQWADEHRAAQQEKRDE